MKILVAIVSFCLMCAVSAVVFKDCGSVEGGVKSVIVSNCAPAAPVCILKKGTTVNFTVDFTPKQMVQNVTAVVHGIIERIPVPFPIPQPNACKDSGLVCPLKPNKPYAYSTQLPIKSLYPSLQLLVKWELKDSNGKDVFCVFIPVHIE